MGASESSDNEERSSFWNSPGLKSSGLHGTFGNKVRVELQKGDITKNTKHTNKSSEKGKSTGSCEKSDGSGNKEKK